MRDETIAAFIDRLPPAVREDRANRDVAGVSLDQLQKLIAPDSIGIQVTPAGWSAMTYYGDVSVHAPTFHELLEELIPELLDLR